MGLADPVSVALAIVGGISAVSAIAVSFEWVKLPGGPNMLWPIRMLLFASAVAAVAPMVPLA